MMPRCRTRVVDLEAVDRFTIDPPWGEDPATADRVWRAVVATLGPRCDEIWLRYGNLEDVAVFLPQEQYRQLEEFVGPHWGQPDPLARTAPDESALFLADILRDMVTGLKPLGSAVENVPSTPRKYAPYGCAVVPATPALVDFLAQLRAEDPQATMRMLRTLADHWHFRRSGRDVVSTGTGMAALVLELTPDEADLLRRVLLACGLDPGFMVEVTDA